MSTTSTQFDPTLSDDLRFVAIALPILGVLGGALKTAGASDQVMLLVTVPLLSIAFFGWEFVLARRQRHAAEAAATAFSPVRDAPLAQSSRSIVETELRELGRRQRAEQDRLLKEHASSERLARMMERHRSEYEAVLSRRLA